jgi:hypothetical protein
MPRSWIYAMIVLIVCSVASIVIGTIRLLSL